MQQIRIFKAILLNYIIGKTVNLRRILSCFPFLDFRTKEEKLKEVEEMRKKAHYLLLAKEWLKSLRENSTSSLRAFEEMWMNLTKSGHTLDDIDSSEEEIVRLVLCNPI